MSIDKAQSLPKMSDQIQFRKDVPSGTIVINRPQRRNALSHELIQQLKTAFDDFHLERKVKGIILTGGGDVFCSGSDLQLMDVETQDAESMQAHQQEMNDLKDLIEFMLRFPKPIVAAVNGPVAGSGVALMLACDLIVAGQSAEVSFPEVHRGLVPGISAPLLVFRLGASIAANMMLSGKSFDAEYLTNVGLFCDTVRDDLVWARAHEIVSELAAGAPSSHQLIKQLLNESIGESLFTQLSIGAANTAAARFTDSAKKGVEAFLDKKPVDWD